MHNLYYFGADVFVDVVGDGDAVLAVAAELYSGVNGLEQRLFVDAGYDEVAFVDGLGALRAGADADGWEGVAYTGEETTFFWKCAAVADNSEGVHLKAVVVVKAEGLMLDDAWVEFKAAGCKAVAAAWVAAVKYRHVVFLCHAVDGIEEREEVFLGVDILLAVSGKEYVFAFLQAKALMHVAGFDLGKVLMEHFCHWGAGDVGALLGQTAVGKVAAGMFAVRHVHVADDVHDAAVGLLGQALVLAAVACLHVEDGDVQPLGANHA